MTASPPTTKNPMRLDMARAYVESLLENFLGQQKVEPDADGGYPLRFRSAA